MKYFIFNTYFES